MSESELRLHIETVDILRKLATPEWLWCHAANGEAARDARQGAKLRAMGVKPGWPDLTLISLPHGQARFIEFKTEDGKLSPEQAEFESLCIRFAIPHSVVRNLSDAVKVLRHWNAIPTEKEKSDEK